MITGEFPVLPLVGLATLLSLICCAMVKAVAGKTGALDLPDDHRKLQNEPVPLFGGLGLWLAFLLTILMTSSSLISEAGLWPLLISGCLFCLVGLYDDLRSLQPRTKFLCQLAATVPFACWMPQPESLELVGLTLPLGIAGVLLTVFWLTSWANMINLMDGLDGLAGTLSLMISIALMIIAGLQGQMVYCLLALLFAGVLFGFLAFNAHPAVLYLGDAGSLLIGYFLGALSLLVFTSPTGSFSIGIPMALVSVPAFDTIMAILRRRLTGRHIATADRSHLHHSLLKLGYSVWRTWGLISLACLLTCLLSICGVLWEAPGLALLACFCTLCIFITGRYFGYQELRMLLQQSRLQRRPAVVIPFREPQTGLPVEHVAGEITDGILSVLESVPDPDEVAA